MATINHANYNIYITLTANKCSVSQLSVVNNGAFCNDSPVKCTYTEILWVLNKPVTVVQIIITAGI